MIAVEHQCLAASEHIIIIRHAVHSVHLHHILHSSCFFRKCNNWRYIFVLKTFYLYFKLFFIKNLLEELWKLLSLLLKLLRICFRAFEIIWKLWVDSAEGNLVIFLLKLRNIRCINLVCKNECIDTLCLKQIDILNLLFFICYIEYGILLFFLVLRSFCVSRFCSIICSCTVSIHYLYIICLCIFAICWNLLRSFNIFRKCNILALKILVNHEILHLIAELCILETTIFNKRRNVLPVLLIVLAFNLVHADKLVCNLLCNVLRNLLYKTIVLECTSWYVKRKVRTVDNTL